MLSSTIGFLKTCDVEYGVASSLSGECSMRCGGSAALVAYPDDLKKLIRVLEYLSSEKIRYRILGNITNTLVREGEYSGVVVRTNKVNEYFVLESGEVIAECGADFKRMSARLAGVGLGGAEEMFMIPGTVGAMTVGNAGAHGLSLSDIFLYGCFFDPRQDRICFLDRGEMRFSYRGSLAKSDGLICLYSVLSFVKADFSEIRSKIARFASIRRKAQPTGAASLGSIFKRRNGIGMGCYIEQAGLKGYKIGGASVSQKHAGFIVNDGSATADDVLMLIEHIKSVIYEKFGFIPEEEIEVL